MSKFVAAFQEHITGECREMHFDAASDEEAWAIAEKKRPTDGEWSFCRVDRHCAPEDIPWDESCVPV